MCWNRHCTGGGIQYSTSRVELDFLVVVVRGIAESISHFAYCDSCIRTWSVRLSVTLVLPAKAIGRNEMPFGRGTGVVQTCIRRGPRSPWAVKIGIAVCGQTVKDSGLVTMDNLTSCSNSAAPYTTVPSPTVYDFPFPQITSSQQRRLMPNDVGLCLFILFVVCKNQRGHVVRSKIVVG